MLKKSFFAIVLILNSFGASAQIIDNNYQQNQPNENSLLSRFGFGNLTPQYFAPNSGMGGLSAAYRDANNYNPFNPASLPAMRVTSLEFGLYAKNNEIETAGSKEAQWSGNLNYIAIGFPTYSVINEVLDRKPRKIRWGMGLTLMPYNTIGYNIKTVSPAQNPLDSANYSNYFVGSGGSYRAMWGNGFSYKGLSVGANVGYIFGKMNNIRQIQLEDRLIISYSDYFDDSYLVRGLTWNAGMQYAITLDPKKTALDKGDRKHIVFGVYGNPAQQFNTKSDRTYRRINNQNRGTVDTIISFTDKAGVGKFPTELTAGIMYENGLLFRGGIEYKMAKWSEYENEAKVEKLLDASQFSVGAEFILDRNKLKTEEEKTRWRLGFRTGTDPRQLNNEQVKSWAATAGFCLPLRVGRGTQISYMNIGLEYGQLTTTKLAENYFRINWGFTLNDNSWFLKRKFQ
jgi:hypothetical protein